MTQAPITREDLEAVWRAHGLGAIEELTSVSGGRRNRAFYVNRDFVLRINTLDPHLPKFRNEKAALDLLAQSSLPVPRVVLLDESREIFPYDLIILNRLPGASIAESKDSLSGIQLRDLAFDAGKALALLHQHTFAVFGGVSELQVQPFSTWSEFFLDYAGRYLSDALAFRLADRSTIDRLERVLRDEGQRLAEIRRGVFVHSDFHYENILQQDGHLTGLLDFEWSLSGDPALDFVPAGERQRVLPGREGDFIHGYLTLGDLDAGYERRVELYRLFLDLEDAVTRRRLGDPAGPALERMEARLQGWDGNGA
jgi:aminoglycoside phosphotransferase (APT) family kinase protein